MKKKILISDSTDCYFNLALEEFLVRNIDFSVQSILLIYVNDDAIVLGKNQNIYKEVFLPTILNREVKISRRISGGGTVVHDLGNINFAVLESYDLKRVNRYDSSIGFMVECLQSLGVGCFQNERNAIFLENNKKISGSAQFSTKSGILSHFSLLFESNLERINRYLNPNQFTVESKSSQSVRSEITNLKEYLSMSKTEFIEFIAAKYSSSDSVFSLTSDQMKEVNILKDQKYSNEDYIYSPSGNATIKNDLISIEMEQGRIRSVIGLPSQNSYLGKRLDYSEIPEDDFLWKYLMNV